jgi:hypothetical protein
MDITVLFGTREYFEIELLRTPKGRMSISKKITMEETYRELQAELLNDFLCDDKLRVECLRNLFQAYSNLLSLVGKR